MDKDKEVEVVGSREVEANLIMEIADLTILRKKKEKLNGKMNTKERKSRKVLIPTEMETILIEEELIPTREVDFNVNVIDVVVKVIDILNVKVMVKMLVEIL